MTHKERAKMFQELTKHWKRRAELWERLYRLQDEPDAEKERLDIWLELND